VDNQININNSQSLKEVISRELKLYKDHIELKDNVVVMIIFFCTIAVILFGTYSLRFHPYHQLY
jgi:hypothetical protein